MLRQRAESNAWLPPRFSLDPILLLRPPKTEFRREVFVNFGMFHGLFPHHSHHVRGFDSTGLKLRDIQCMNAIDETAVPLIVWIEVRAKAAVDKGIDDIAKRNEQLEREVFH